MVQVQVLGEAMRTDGVPAERLKAPDLTSRKRIAISTQEYSTLCPSATHGLESRSSGC